MWNERNNLHFLLIPNVHPSTVLISKDVCILENTVGMYWKSPLQLKHEGPLNAAGNIYTRYIRIEYVTSYV